MKNIQNLFSKVFKSSVLVFLGLAMAISLVPMAKVSAQMVSGSIVATPDTITAGQSTEIRWNSFDANSISITPGIGSVAPSGSVRVSPTQTTTYTLHISNTVSGSSTDGTATVYVNPVQPQTCQDTRATNYGGPLPCNIPPTGNAPTVNLDADDNSIKEGDSTTLRWTTTNNPTSCTGTNGRNGWSGSKSVSSGSSFPTGDLNSDTTYTITCTNQYGSASDTEIVRVEDEVDNNRGDKPEVNIYANPSTVNYNGSSIITWDSDDADTCRSTGGTDGWAKSSRSRSGTFYANGITRDTTFSISCENDEGTARDSVTVRVNGTQVQGTQPTVIVYADTTSIAYGGNTFIRWSTTNATSCYASGGSSGWSGVKSIGPGSFYTGSMTSGKNFTLTCSNNYGSSTDSAPVNVRGRTITTTRTTPPPRPSPSSLVVITTAIDRNQPILPTLDNTNPRPGDEINYTVTYQNIGTGAISNLVLRLDLPYEVTYMFSNPNNPMIQGNTLIFNLGTLRANGTGTVTVRVRVRDDAAPGALLNFPAVLSYTDPSGYPQSVSANVSAQVWRDGVLIEDENNMNRNNIPLGASIFGAGFWPTSLFGWLFFIILILVLIALVRSLYGGSTPFTKRTVTTVDHH